MCWYLTDITKTTDGLGVTEIKFIFSRKGTRKEKDGITKDISCLKCLEFDLCDDFIKRYTREEIVEMFSAYDWKKLPRVGSISFSRNITTYLSKYIPPSVRHVSFINCDMHDINIVSENVVNIEITNRHEKFYDPTFFDRLPFSLKKISLGIYMPYRTDPIDYVYKNGFHNLPPFLECFELHVYYTIFNSENCYVLEKEQVDDIRKSFTFGPRFKFLKINGKTGDVSDGDI